MDVLVDRLKDVPRRVQLWKKSAARARANIVVSLVCVHCRGVDEEKLKSLKVVNKKNAKIDDSMETFLPAATQIADVIDLENFTDATSPPSSD